MAKEQGLALNPTKISGQCGRLLCCLSYEFESYCELRKGMPKCGKKTSWNNQEWEVIAQNVLARQITLRQGDGTIRIVSMDEFEDGHPCMATPPTVDSGTVVPRQPEGPRRKSRPAASPEPKAQPSPQSATPPEPLPETDETDDTGGEDAAKSGTRRRRRRRRRSSRTTPPDQQGE
jgi:hypothetical protein